MTQRRERVGTASARAALAYGMALAVIACTSPAQSPTPLEAALSGWRPTGLPGAPVVCREVAVDATLHGAQTDPDLAWIVEAASAKRANILWYRDYRARFDPQLSVIDESGAVVLREGDRVTRACLTGLEDPAYWLDPPFRSE